MNTRRRGTLLAVGGFAALLSSCTDKASSSTNVSNAAGKLQVVSTDTECKLSATEVPSGNITFAVENKGSQVTEFYLLAADGLRIVGEVENVGPGITRKLVVKAKSGAYKTACKPGMLGEGIRADFTVTDSGVVSGDSPEVEALLADATKHYAAYVRDQSDQLLTRTEEFAALYVAGKDDEARAAYPQTRTHWERIEPVAESFGDLDPKLDAREADLEPGQAWTGWHRIEKDLWPPASDATYKKVTDQERTALAAQMVADTKELHTRIGKLSYSADQLGNGAKELLDEVATGKVTGEEEIWSGTDLWDFQANVDGARIAFEVLDPVLQTKDKGLSTELTQRFSDVQKLLDEQKKGDGFTNYKDLSATQIKAMADAVSALGEPLSRLTAAVVL
jgi:iron uptake system component EfeO